MPPELTQQEIELRIYEQASPCDARPYPNEHAARLKPPEDFAADTFRRSSDGTIYGSIKVPDTADVIWGKLKGKAEKSDPVHPQAIRFPTKDWTEAQAKKWLKDNDVKYIVFEPASGSKDQPLTEQQKGEILNHLHTRDFPLDRSTIDKEKRTVGMTFSSQTPVLRWYGFEILSHKAEHIRMERWKAGAAFLMDHNPRDQRGIIENGKLNEKAMIEGTPLISRHQRGEELWMDIQDGIRKYTSIGYAVHYLREMEPEEMSAELQEACLQNKCGAYISEDWEPLEGSSVAIPADTSVGVGRSLEEFFIKHEQRNQPSASEPVGAAQQSTIHQRSASMAEPKDKTTPTPEEILHDERERIAAIDQIASKFTGRIDKIDELKTQAVKDGWTGERFKAEIADRVADGKTIESPDTELGLGEEEKKGYSLLRLIQSELTGGKIKADFERECAAAIKRKAGDREWKGIPIPWDIQQRSLAARINSSAELSALRLLAAQAGLRDAVRALTVADATGAAELVGSELRADMFIDLLRNKAIAGRAGVQILYGLQGNLVMPRQTGAATWEWTGESGTTTGSAPTTGSITLSPKEGRAYTEYQRMLILQSTPSVEILVQNDLFSIARLGIDKAVFHGSASANQPRGIANESGIGAVSGSGLGWEAIVEFETDVADANGDVDTMFYITNPVVRGLMKTRNKALNQAVYLMDDRGLVNGYGSLISKQISAGYLFFGDFSPELLGYWGNLDLLVNPFAGDKTGTVRVNIYADVDCRLRQAGAISMANDVD